MALPSSGQISSGDVRTELDLSSVSSFSFASAAYGNYVFLNGGSPTLPPSSGQIDMTDWYSYCHTCSSSCGTSIYTAGEKDFRVIDMGTTSGTVSYSGFTDGCGCLVGGTKIITDFDDETLIESLQVGQKVFNGSDYNTIKNFDKFQVTKIYKFNDGILESSESHNHYVVNSYGEIEVKKSYDVRIGEKFISKNKSEIFIDKIEIVDGLFEVYNIETDGNNLYVANGIVTHNKCSNPCWRIVDSYPYNSSGSLTATTVVSGNSSPFSGTFSYTYSSSKRYHYFMPACATSAGLQLQCPTAATVTISLYHKQGTNGIGVGYYIRFGTDCGNWDYAGSSCFYNGSSDPPYICYTSDSCQGPCTFTVNQNTTVYILVLDCNDNPISFNAADNTSTCPSNSAAYCDDSYCGATPFSFNSGTSNKNIAVTVFANKFGYTPCLN